jgi:hypothetical protein
VIIVPESMYLEFREWVEIEAKDDAKNELLSYGYSIGDQTLEWLAQPSMFVVEDEERLWACRVVTIVFDKLEALIYE